MTREIVFMKRINSETVSKLIEECGEDKEISLLLNSKGGDPIDAIAFLNFARGKHLSLKVTVIGSCDSSAMIILCAAKVRRAYRNTTFLFHFLRRSYSEEKQFSANDLAVELADMKAVEKRYRQIVAKVIGLPLKELNKYFEAEKDLSASQVCRLGLLTQRPL